VFREQNSSLLPCCAHGRADIARYSDGPVVNIISIRDFGRSLLFSSDRKHSPFFHNKTELHCSSFRGKRGSGLLILKLVIIYSKNSGTAIPFQDC
jgi:hypothetical protein